MKRKTDLVKWFVFVLIVALVLTGCIRSAQEGGEEGEATEAAPTAVVIPTSPPVDEGQGQPSGEEGYPGPEGETGTDPVPPAEDPAAPTPTPGEVVVPPTATPAPPTSETTPPGECQEQVHTVQPGENLFRIGLQYGFTAQELATYNGIPNINVIYVGDQIRIPCK